MEVVCRTIPEIVVPGKPLGRHVEHDPRSRDYAVRGLMTTVPLRTLIHRRFGGPFDQGELGSCTGNAIAGIINTQPVHIKGTRLLREADAVSIYHLATVLDGFPGVYPPDDTGSSGLAAAKAAQQKGYIGPYRHAFGPDDALQALMHVAVATGVNWYEGMDNPSEQGFVYPTGQVRGGHEFEVIGYVAARKPYVVCVNSWGTDWGLNGRFKIFVKDWARLLSEDGDVTVLSRRS